ncbi:MAG TPA: serine/threonine-protein kinase [Nitrospiria bacterium]|jgi:serine/threonine protein kinase|nr:serine/threonine-protein kinase [Nitrospiria bacterium]
MNTPVHYGKYLLIDKVGTGGMAELFMAKQTGLKGFEKMMAIKRILPHLTEDAEFISMFINEAKLAALLTHQNIVQIFDLGHVENSYFIAMEYVMGKDLRTILQRAKALHLPMSIGHALLIITKVCAGLDYAHRKKDLTGRDLNIVHRDVSPQNILVSYEGEIKLVDFGIAKAASQSSETRTGILKGKLSYMAPEQAWGRPVDRRADIFAVGILLYELLTGHKLFKGDNDFNTLEKVREAQVEPPPTSLNQQVAPELEAIILKALAKEPDQRFQSASELQTALEDHMSKKGYDFSAVRLAQYLQTLFQHDIEQDSHRFQTASGTSVGAGLPDQSTVIRPRHAGDGAHETTPSRSSGRRPMPTPLRPSRRASAFRTALLTFLSIMGAAMGISTINPPFLQSIAQNSPEVRVAVLRLSTWPALTVEWARHLLTAASGSSSPASEVAVSPQPVSERVPPPAVQPEPPAAVDSPPPGPVVEPGSQEPVTLPAEITEEPDRRLTPLEKEETRRLLKDAKAAYDERRLDDAERMFRRIIELNPKVPVAYHFLGMITLERKDPDGANRIFEEASRKFPDYPVLHYDLGFLYLKRGVISQAQDELQKALALNPRAPMADRARTVLQDFKRPSDPQEVKPPAVDQESDSSTGAAPPQ